MNIKNTINFKTLREKGPNALELKDDEVVQVTTKQEVLCVVRQEFLQELLKNQDLLKGFNLALKNDSPSELSFHGELDTSNFPPLTASAANSLTSPRSNGFPLKKSAQIFGGNSLNTKPSIEERLTALEKAFAEFKKQGT